MTKEQFLKNLLPPEGNVDVVLDTDTYNEVDDQFAIAYMLNSPELNPVAIYAAPFFNDKSTGPEDGMEKSYNEIFHILKLAGRTDMNDKVYKGAREYLKDEKTPAVSPAAEHLCKIAMNYSPENPLYVVGIAAITNIASALLMKPEIKENIVVVWLGGHAWHFNDVYEFNMKQDIAAARVVMGSGVPFVQLPCEGCVSEFKISKPEILHWLSGKNPLADYLGDYAIAISDDHVAHLPWARTIWDVTVIGWLLNKNGRYMHGRIENVKLPGYDGVYHDCEKEIPMCYVDRIYRNPLMGDLINKLIK